MLLQDRYTGKTMDSSSLPSQIELGRYFVSESGHDITNRVVNVGSEKIISQDLLDSKNKSLQELFCFFNVAVRTYKDNDFSIIPLIQSVKEKLSLTEFEILLESKVFHLEEIFRQPHYLLQRTIEKVNVSKAKRIPAKGYQNLASHTEDWIHKSIVSFKPRRILNEELELLYDVYENQVTVALIERCLIYLNGRIKEIQDIGKFLSEYNKLLSDRNDSNGWYKKIDRNLSLIGCVYEDDNYTGRMSRSEILSMTHQRLLSLSKRLKALQSTTLFSEINRRMVQNFMSEQDIRPTNVIANHKHYRYVRDLWIALNKVDYEKSERERDEYEQNVIGGVRNYSKVVIAYIMHDILNYELDGNYNKWEAIHPYFPSISLEETTDQRICITIGNSLLSILTLASTTTIQQSDLPENNYILCLGNEKNYGNIVAISPYDVDSIERVGAIIKSYILKDLVGQIRETHEYSHNLRDFTSYIYPKYLSFNTVDYTYTFKCLDFTNLNSGFVESLKSNEKFKQKSRIEKDSIIKDIESLVEDINKNAKKLSDKVICIDCLNSIQRRYLTQLDYIQCTCGFTLDCTNNSIVLKNKDPKYSSLKREDWGMDYIEFQYK